MSSTSSNDPSSVARDAAGAAAAPRRSNFIRDIIDRDLAAGKRGGQVVTRFPPEPNGYLHIGHAKSICLNFGLALDYGGRCHLRFDDTNPEKEEVEYVDSIQADVRWLGFDWGEHLHFASDYFEQMYAWAEQLIRDGKAYVDSQSREQIRENRGSIYEPGKDSPYRDRSVDENLDLFRRMRAGEFADGEHVLRARIDMAAPNMLLRDPLLYRIKHAHHHRTGDAWCIYPMYDYAHCLEDAIEHVTHSICTLEFEENRALYDWILDQLPVPAHPQQIEFARLSLDYTVMSKRKLLELVRDGHVAGWDDPRMPTIAGLRRRGVTPKAIRDFADMIGVAKANSTVDIGKLEFCIREALNPIAPRVMAVLDPLKVTLTNWPEDRVDTLDAAYWPHDVPNEGARPVPFGRTLYIERDDFAEVPPKKWHRLAPGAEVRLRHAYVIRCDEVVRDAAGQVTELRCTVDLDTRGADPADGRKIKGTLHWVSAAHAVPAEVRLYDRLFSVPKPDGDPEVDFKTHLNPESLVVRQALVEPSLAGTPGDQRFQFERQGYFVTDAVDSRPDRLVFNRVVGLRDSWAKLVAAEAGPQAAPSAPAPRRDKPAAPKEPAGPRTSERDQRRAESPELAARFERYQRELGLTREDADVLSGDPAVSAFFEAALLAHDGPKTVANWLVNELQRELKERPIDQLPFDGRAFGRLVALVDRGAIATPAGKEVLAHLLAHGGDPEAIVRERGLEKVDDRGALEAAIATVLADNPDEVTRYRGGSKQLFGFFMGQVMQATRGKADPKLAKQLLTEHLAQGR